MFPFLFFRFCAHVTERKPNFSHVRFWEKKKKFNTISIASMITRKHIEKNDEGGIRSCSSRQGSTTWWLLLGVNVNSFLIYLWFGFRYRKGLSLEWRNVVWTSFLYAARTCTGFWVALTWRSVHTIPAFIAAGGWVYVIPKSRCLEFLGSDSVRYLSTHITEYLFTCVYDARIPYWKVILKYNPNC